MRRNLTRFAAWIESALREPRPAEIALAAALLALVLLYLPLRLSFLRDWEPSSLAQLEQLVSPRFGPDDHSLPPLATPPYAAIAVHLPTDSRNPFSFKPKPTPTPAPPTPTPPVMTPTPYVEPPKPTPTPYTTSFTLVGLAASPTRKVRVAFLKADDSIYIGVEGQEIVIRRGTGPAERHIVKAIEIDKVRMAPALGEGEAVLELQSGR